MPRISILILLLLAFPAYSATVTDVGDATTKALQKQAAGDGAVETRPMLKDAADRAYERYLQSFTYPIPDQFEREPGFSNSN